MRALSNAPQVLLTVIPSLPYATSLTTSKGTSNDFWMASRSSECFFHCLGFDLNDRMNMRLRTAVALTRLCGFT